MTDKELTTSDIIAGLLVILVFGGLTVLFITFIAAMTHNLWVWMVG